MTSVYIMRDAQALDHSSNAAAQRCNLLPLRIFKMMPSPTTAQQTVWTASDIKLKETDQSMWILSKASDTDSSYPDAV